MDDRKIVLQQNRGAKIIIVGFYGSQETMSYSFLFHIFLQGAWTSIVLFFSSLLGKKCINISSPITPWQIDGDTMETVRNYIFLGSRITVDSD